MSKKPAVGTIFYQQIGGVYTAVAQVKEVSIDDVGGNSIEVPDLNSPADGNMVPWKDKIWDGLGDPGSSSFSIFMDPALAGHISILSSNFAPTNWKAVYPNSGGAYDLWQTSTTKCSRKITVAEALMMDVKMENSGPFTQF